MELSELLQYWKISSSLLIVLQTKPSLATALGQLINKCYGPKGKGKG